MSWAREELEAILQLVRERAGLAIPPHRRESALQEIDRKRTEAGARDPDHYRCLLETDPAVFEQLITELTVGETYFFREPGQFEFLRRKVIPALRRRSASRPLRVWSAGCASGEEAYSLAILLHEERLAPPARVLATDIARDALVRARRGEYRRWSLRGELAPLARAYLRRDGDRLILEERIRALVRVESLNLASDSYPSPATSTCNVDVILCRNVLIYFDRPTVAEVAHRLWRSLAPGGWLLTGACDPPLASLAPFEVIRTTTGIFYRRPEGRDTARLASAGEVRPRAPAAPGQEQQLQRCPQTARGTHPAREPVSQLPARIREMANSNPEEAEAICRMATLEQPLSVELHFLHGVLLLALDEAEEAMEAIRRALFLEPRLAVGHLTLGSVLERLGDRSAARRAYRQARELCLVLPEQEPVPLGEGERARDVVEAAEAQIALLESRGGSS